MLEALKRMVTTSGARRHVVTAKREDDLAVEREMREAAMEQARAAVEQSRHVSERLSAELHRRFVEGARMGGYPPTPRGPAMMTGHGAAMAVADETANEERRFGVSQRLATLEEKADAQERLNETLERQVMDLKRANDAMRAMLEAFAETMKEARHHEQTNEQLSKERESLLAVLKARRKGDV